MNSKVDSFHLHREYGKKTWTCVYSVGDDKRSTAGNAEGQTAESALRNAIEASERPHPNEPGGKG